jgi:hypothetical protein
MKAYRGLVRDKTRRSSIETIATTPLFIGSRKKLRRIWLRQKGKILTVHAQNDKRWGENLRRAVTFSRKVMWLSLCGDCLCDVSPSEQIRQDLRNGSPSFLTGV